MRIFLFFLIVCVALSSPKAIVKRANQESNWSLGKIAKVGALGAGAGLLAYAGYRGVKHLMNRGDENAPMQQNGPAIGRGVDVDEPVVERIHH